MTSRTFRFEPLLQWAGQREEQQTLHLSAASAAEREVLAAIAALEAERERQWIAFADPAGAFDAEQYRTAVAYVERLTQRIEEQRAALAEAQTRVVEVRDVLLETVKERRSLEHLKDRDAATAALEEGRREDGAQDDLNMSRHIRRGARDGRGAA
ncbi:MAG: flagellar export protein FliJ [Dehalococcoidia bacterium]